MGMKNPGIMPGGLLFYSGLTLEPAIVNKVKIPVLSASLQHSSGLSDLSKNATGFKLVSNRRSNGIIFFKIKPFI